MNRWDFFFFFFRKKGRKQENLTSAKVAFVLLENTMNRAHLVTIMREECRIRLWGEESGY